MTQSSALVKVQMRALKFSAPSRLLPRPRGLRVPHDVQIEGGLVGLAAGVPTAERGWGLVLSLSGWRDSLWWLYT